MKSKKVLSIFLTAVLAASLLVGCSSTPKTTEAPEAPVTQEQNEPASEAKYADGFYYAVADEFASDGWKYNVAIEVKDGKITDAEWNGLSIAGGKDKITLAADGEYGMIKASKIGAEWNEQSAKVSAHLIEIQDPTIVEYTDADGHSDAISGATITVKDFFELADKALKAQPIAKGNYTDGYYHNAAEPTAEGETTFAQLVVVNGSIVDANINVLMKNKADKASNKKTISIAGEYGMEKVASAPAHEQLVAVEKFLIEKQSTEVNYIDADKTDSITGATISVKDYLTLVEGALSGAPAYSIFK